jgi:hypothetical protein
LSLVRLEPPPQPLISLRHSEGLSSPLLKATSHGTQPRMVKLEIGAAKQNRVAGQRSPCCREAKRQHQLKQIRLGGLALNLASQNGLEQITG